MINQTYLAKIVSLILVLTSTLTVVPARNDQQQPQRDRRVLVSPPHTPTPLPSPTPVASPTPPVSPVETPVTIHPVRNGVRTIDELQARISEVLAKPELAPAMVGIKVTSLESGKVLFEENASKLLRPASNMKLYTVAAALDRLSPDYRFTTTVLGAARPDTSGVVRGDVIIYGQGDPTFAARFNNGDYFKGIDNLATRIVNAGVKRIEGDLVGDESYFVGPKYGSGWEWEDLTWYYGAEISSLTINDNALDLFIKPGP